MNRIVFLSIYIVSCLFLFCLSVNGLAKYGVFLARYYL